LTPSCRILTHLKEIAFKIMVKHENLYHYKQMFQIPKYFITIKILCVLLFPK